MSALPSPFTSRLGLAEIHMARGRPAQAEPLLRQAVAVRRAGLTADHPDLAEALRRLGACLTALGRRAAADSLLAEADRISSR